VATPETVFAIEPPFAFLTFNRPEARNAMTWAMYDALVDACDQVDADPRVRVWILRGAGGKAFASGTDITQFQSFRTPSDAMGYEQRISAVLERLERVTKPTIARIEGYAAGAGCAIALTCDLRVATEDSAIGIPVARTPATARRPPPTAACSSSRVRPGRRRCCSPGVSCRPRKLWPSVW